MARWFNTTGPCNPKKHYTLPPTARLPGNMERLIAQESYFVMHAPGSRLSQFTGVAAKKVTAQRVEGLLLSVRE